MKEGKNKRNLILFNLIMLIAVASVFIWGVKLYFHIGDDSYTDDAQVEKFINPINARVQAYIKEIRFQEHQVIRKGDTMVVLDSSELAIQLQQAEAAYMNALASKNVTSSGVSTSENGIIIADANLAEAKARLENAHTNFMRYTNLLKDDAVTKAQYDQIKSEYDMARARFNSLHSQITTSRLSSIEATKKLDVNDADIKRAKALLDLAKLNLSYTVIKAPYDCIAGRRLIQEGQLVGNGQKLFDIIKSNEQWIVANYREKQINSIHLGQKLNIRVDALGRKTFEGEVIAISGATGSKFSVVPVDNSTGNFVKVQQRIPVRIAFTDTNKQTDLGLLQAGMNVEVTLKD